MRATRPLAAALLATALAVPATGAARGEDGGAGHEPERAGEGAANPSAPPAAAAVAPVAPVAAEAPVAVAATTDVAAPLLGGVGATLRRGRDAGRLRVTVSEDARLDVAMRALGRSRDLVATRRLALYARAGTHSLRLPEMNLTARRYRLRIVAADQAGNRSAPVVVIARTARP